MKMKPFVERFTDCTEIDRAAPLLSKAVQAKVKARELGYVCGYLGLFWVGRKPNKKKIVNLLFPYATPKEAEYLVKHGNLFDFKE